MPGLYLFAPDDSICGCLAHLLHDYDLPLAGFTAQQPAPAQTTSRAAFLRRASVAALLGQPISAEALRMHLMSCDPLVANVLRRHLFLRLSLMPFLRTAGQPVLKDGALLLADAMLIVPVADDDAVDTPLPPGIWTELHGRCHQAHLRGMRGYNETPILLQENVLLPVSMNGQSLTQTASSETDRLTLHWFQPEEESTCTLADGTFYHARQNQGRIDVDTNADSAFHLILHHNGVETLVR